MAALTGAASYTKVHSFIASRIRHNVYDVAFGDGSSTYPTGGVPLTLNGLGYHRNIDSITCATQPNDGFLYKPTEATTGLSGFALLINCQAIRTGTTAAGAPGNGCFILNAESTETVIRAPGTTTSTTYEIGPGVEVSATYVPTSNTTVRLAMTGW